MAKAPQKAGKSSNKKLGTQNKKLGTQNKKLGTQNTKQFKPKKPMSLKQKLHKESKIVKVNNLKWKEVEIPDNLEDYEGFFGLEEIEGVDVKYVDGKAEFVVKEDKSEIKTDDEIDNQEDKIEEDVEDEDDQDEEDQDEEDQDEEDQDEEFTGFSDNDESIAESKKNNLVKDKKASVSILNGKKASVSEEKSSNPDTLQGNVFDSEALLELPDDIHLPNWQDEKSGLSLSPYILNGLSALNFKKPTPIQKETIPLAISGKDVIGKATTGSGKTLAYGIPILERYLANLETIKLNKKNNIINAPTGIIFAPTRELAHQVVDHLNKIAKYSPLSSHGIVSITGGLSIQKQERLLLHGPGILVATPGRCLELLQKDIELVKRLASTEIVVLDEADRLLQDGHFEEFEKILDLFKKHRPKLPNKDWKWQTLVFSATFARDLFGKLDKFQKKKVNETGKSLFDNDEILKILNDKLNFKDKKPVLIDANPKEIVSGQITEALVECGPTERDLYLYYFLLLYPGSTLVFANSIDSVKRLVPLLNNLNIPAFAIHSSMMQKQRLRSLERFKEASSKNETAVLVASDVAARGLDIPNIDHVAHYHLPRSADVYIHRSGRTARAGKEGVSVMFCSPQEASGPLRKLRKIVANNSSKNSRLNMHTDVKLLPIEMDLISQIRQRVAVSSKLADSSISSTSTRKESSWVKQAADELGVEDLSDLDDFEDDIIKKQRKRKEGKLLSKEEYNSLRYELKTLLLQQLRKNHRRSYLTSGLENLAHQMVTGDTHKEVLGHIKVNALNDIAGSKAKSKKAKSDKPKANKVTKKNNKKNDKKSNKK